MGGLVRTRSIVAVGVLIVAGIVVLAVSGGDDVAGTVGFALLGLGAVLGTSLAFYAVGRSEDIERERERSSRDGG